jgi:hypothetical protein
VRQGFKWQVHGQTHTLTHTRTHRYTLIGYDIIYIHTYIQTYIHTYIHTYLLTYILTYRYTVSFWWKALEGTTWDSINQGQMLAYSSFVPPRVLFALDFYGNGQKINYWHLFSKSQCPGILL